MEGRRTLRSVQAAFAYQVWNQMVETPSLQTESSLTPTSEVAYKVDMVILLSLGMHVCKQF